ncbi:hypothetical protein [Nocardioides aquiterrae]|uniref:Uncharacterized protein n=1 Tax=Nocardioides aquiterrae TaxID=203799 RepID=A0ABN1UCU6_9ACTN
MTNTATAIATPRSGAARRRAKAAARRRWASADRPDGTVRVGELEELWDLRLGRIPRDAVAVMVCPCGTRMWIRDGATDEDWERFREDEAAHDYCDQAGGEVMGDIGVDPREIEFEPLTAPSVPEPIRTPAPAPAPAGAIATSIDGLDAYRPLPVEVRVMVWVKPNAMPGPARIHGKYELVLLYPPEGRRSSRNGAGCVPDVLIAPKRNDGFAGAKPPEWTRWVLDAMSYNPDTDTLDDLFHGSGAVAAVAAQGQLMTEEGA